MNTLNHNRQTVTALHLLFWIVSFNIFNSFFTRGIESGYIIEDLSLTFWHVLIISNITILVILGLFIWFFKHISRWIKWSVTAVLFVVLGLAIIQIIFPKKDIIILPILLVFFIDNFLYVIIFHITVIAAVYLNAKILIVKYLSAGKFGLYLVSAVGLAVIAGIMNYALFDLIIDKLFPQLYFISWFKVWELILIMIGYILVTTIVFLLWQYGQMLIENREKALHELSALKAQINPHFLFNNLNTIYAMAEKGDHRTKEVILQLSDFLRYVLYDTSSETIGLEKEIEIIKTYVGLQKERINPNTTEVIVNVDGDFSQSQIAPLLLLPLVENCFKHGIGKDIGTIRIDIKYSGHQLHFSTKNRIERRENPLNHVQGGIGILNVEKRLNLLYPDKHTLTFEENGEVFMVKMTIDLD